MFLLYTFLFDKTKQGKKSIARRVVSCTVYITNADIILHNFMTLCFARNNKRSYVVCNWQETPMYLGFAPHKNGCNELLIEIVLFFCRLLRLWRWNCVCRGAMCLSNEMKNGPRLEFKMDFYSLYTVRYIQLECDPFLCFELKWEFTSVINTFFPKTT